MDCGGERVEPIVKMHQIRKYYKMGEVTIKAVDGIDFVIEKGEFAVIVGPSGAGKPPFSIF